MYFMVVMWHEVGLDRHIIDMESTNVANGCIGGFTYTLMISYYVNSITLPKWWRYILLRACSSPLTVCLYNWMEARITSVTSVYFYLSVSVYFFMC